MLLAAARPHSRPLNATDVGLKQGGLTGDTQSIYDFVVLLALTRYKELSHVPMMSTL
jgi:hypothetical protein